AVTDTAGHVVERTDYQPYGSPIGKTVDGIGYTGHAMDGATGLTYMQQRYYDQDLGRFLSVDPVAADSVLAANFNRYWYANNNPYRFTDPDGRQSRDFEYISRASGTYMKIPQRSDKDWLGPAIGISLGVVAAPALAFGGFELGMVALTNPVTTNAIATGLAEAVAGTSLGVAAGSGRNVVVTAEKVREALAGSNMLTTQRAISMPVVQRYADSLASGSVAPAIKVADGVIVDGNHRFVAGRVMGQEPPTQPGTISPGQLDQVRPVQEMKVDPTDWGNR
ncbi:wall-associated protein, partial [Xanthomonas citri pv. malvacearum str. GSPB1386]